MTGNGHQHLIMVLWIGDTDVRMHTHTLGYVVKFGEVWHDFSLFS